MPNGEFVGEFIFGINQYNCALPVSYSFKLDRNLPLVSMIGKMCMLELSPMKPHPSTKAQYLLGFLVVVYVIDQYDQQCQYWQQILGRVVKVNLFLRERGLALRGKDETIGSVHNGNFLGILELLSEYGGFFAKHIERCGYPGKCRISYLSSTICNEFIDIIGDLMLTKIIQETKESKYYGIIVDSTSAHFHPQICGSCKS